MKNKVSKPKILSAHGSLPTARNIRNEIEEITGIRYYISTETAKDVLFRYGNSNAITGKETNLNSPEFINLARSKLLWSDFAQKNNIYSPIYHKEEIPADFPVLIRTTLTGFGGRGIIVCNDLEEFNSRWNNNYWWTKFVKCSFEVRVHLFDNEIKKIYKKERDGEDNSPIRNAENGYHFALKDEGNEKYPKLIPLCQTIGNLLVEIGGHFCAIDIGWDSSTKQYFVFEINSAPGLNSVNVTEYSNFIINKLGLERKEN